MDDIVDKWIFINGYDYIDINLPLIVEYRKFMSDSKFRAKVTLMSIIHSNRTGELISTHDVMNIIFERLLNYNTQKKLEMLISIQHKTNTKRLCGINI